MALRSFASQVLPRLGFSLQPATELSWSVSRAFATVVDGVKYATSHEWARVEGDVATIGISDFAQQELGDVVYVELPGVGATVSKGESFGVVESVKAASDMYAPLSGEVIETNANLTNEPSLVNNEPFEGGWLMKVKISDATEANDLLDAAAYAAQSEKDH